MAETQRHEGELSAPPARHRAPTQNAMNSQEMQPVGPAPNSLGNRLIGYLASIICLAGAVYCLWVMRDVLFFLLLIGVATGQISIQRALNRRK